MGLGGLRALARPLGILVRVDVTDPAVALTFDDGPHPRWTPVLLDILRRHGARSTFFLDGPAAARQPNLVRELRAQGHAVGLHGWAHQSAQHVSTMRGLRPQLADIRRCARAVGIPSRLYRPPYGHESRWTRAASALAGCQPVYWSQAIEDWLPLSAEELTDRLVAAFRPGSILLLHDGLRQAADVAAFDRTNVLEAVDQALDCCSDEVSFVTVPELLGRGTPVVRFRRQLAPPLPAMVERLS